MLNHIFIKEKRRQDQALKLPGFTRFLPRFRGLDPFQIREEKISFNPGIFITVAPMNGIFPE